MEINGIAHVLLDATAESGTIARGGLERLPVVVTAIRVFRVGEDDWVVQEHGGRDLGHYPTQADAEAVGRMLARARRAVLLVHDQKGRVKRTDFSRLWRRLFGR